MYAWNTNDDDVPPTSQMTTTDPSNLWRRKTQSIIEPESALQYNTTANDKSARQPQANNLDWESVNYRKIYKGRKINRVGVVANRPLLRVEFEKLIIQVMNVWTFSEGWTGGNANEDAFL